MLWSSPGYSYCSIAVRFDVATMVYSPTSCSIPLLGGFLAAIPREVFLGPLSAPWVSQHYLSGPLFSPSKWHGVPVTHRPSNFTAPTKPVLRFCLLCVECVLRSGWEVLRYFETVKFTWHQNVVRSNKIREVNCRYGTQWTYAYVPHYFAREMEDGKRCALPQK